MNTRQLIDTANGLVADDKGLLAMDESNPTCNKRFAKLGIPETGEARRAYRELLDTIGSCCSCGHCVPVGWAAIGTCLVGSSRLQSGG